MEEVKRRQGKGGRIRNRVEMAGEDTERGGRGNKEKVEKMTQSVKCLPYKREGLTLIPRIHIFKKVRHGDICLYFQH